MKWVLRTMNRKRGDTLDRAKGRRCCAFQFGLSGSIMRIFPESGSTHKKRPSSDSNANSLPKYSLISVQRALAHSRCEHHAYSPLLSAASSGTPALPDVVANPRGGFGLCAAAAAVVSRCCCTAIAADTMLLRCLTQHFTVMPQATSTYTGRTLYECDYVAHSSSVEPTLRPAWLASLLCERPLFSSCGKMPPSVKS